ncbi:hypothetical protein G6F57_020643 [Rhizopus arrhizus]|nr:hypothetical protein G6F57_020643 [Rhizopus arrhizus]
MAIVWRHRHQKRNGTLIFLRQGVLKPQHLSRGRHQRARPRGEQQQVLPPGLRQAHVRVAHIDGRAQHARKRRVVLHGDQYRAHAHEIVGHRQQHRLALLRRAQRFHVNELVGVQRPVGLAAILDLPQRGRRIAFQFEGTAQRLGGLQANPSTATAHAWARRLSVRTVLLG